MRRTKEPWQKLTSGLYVPPYLKFAPGYPCCCGEDCSGCTLIPEEWEVVITGATDGVFDCTDADCLNDYNGTYILGNLHRENLEETYPLCVWDLELDPEICDFYRVIRLEMQFVDLADTLNISVLLDDSLPYSSPPRDRWNFFLDATEDIDCSVLNLGPVLASQVSRCTGPVLALPECEITAT